VSSNLTELVVDGGPALYDPTTTTAPARVEAVFFDLRSRLIQEIERADAIVGCVAWLTDGSILSALAKVPHGVQIVVQKEDFLRPDHPGVGRVDIRRMYEALPRFEMYCLPGIASSLNVCGPGNSAPVRCIGAVQESRRNAIPRSHHKFCVFLQRRETEPNEDGDRQDYFAPLRVWTGSFNWTWNASRSLENAVLIESPKIAERFALEWSKAYAVSEALDWSHQWDDMRQGFRVGT